MTWAKVKSFTIWYIGGLMLENGKPSLTRFMALVSFILFAGVTIYLVVKDKEWAAYASFATITGGGGLVAQLVNKVNNSLNNSEDKQYPL